MFVWLTNISMGHHKDAHFDILSGEFWQCRYQVWWNVQALRSTIRNSFRDTNAHTHTHTLFWVRAIQHWTWRQMKASVDYICIYIYIYIHIHIYMYVYIYIYIERERDRYDWCISNYADGLEAGANPFELLGLNLERKAVEYVPPEQIKFRKGNSLHEKLVLWWPWLINPWGIRNHATRYLPVLILRASGPWVKSYAQSAY